MIVVDRAAVRRRQLEQRPVDQHRVERLRREVREWAGPVEWYTLEDVARLCHRHPGTIRNLVSRHDLPRRLLWKTIRRQRRRVVMFAPPVARWLQEITLGAPSKRERRAGAVSQVIERGRAMSEAEE